MIIVTGGAGFIGSNLVRALNAAGHADILVVDDLRDARKILNLSDCRIADYVDMHEFGTRMAAGHDFGPKLEAIFHQGACTDTTEWNGLLMMRSNYDFSRHVLRYATERRVPLVYASSASVYGAGREFRVSEECERPINVYAFSKLMFDRHVRQVSGTFRSPVVGLRYFNVYGPGEAHKGGMASVIHHFRGQLASGDEIRLFAGSDGYGDGEQVRDFIHVDDIVAVNLWAWRRGCRSGIYNLGTGQARSFNDVARAVLRWHGRGRITYIPFPEHLKGSYQSYTQADLTGLRAAGYDGAFIPIEEGVPRYLDAVA
ncbi:MAG: ADP-glyceromanno-heptose 6-epimerase [Gammaproteobacteria bacterium]|nr:ADP-glyceromanno-heptose 6-epimerase [Gammaproteobacteria bacterium]